MNFLLTYKYPRSRPDPIEINLQLEELNAYMYALIPD